MKRFIIGFITLYRWLISPFLPPSCRFTPTCSRYAISAIECHGIRKGLWMTIKRLLKCHPYANVESTIDYPESSPSSSSSFSNLPDYRIVPANTSRVKYFSKRAHRI